MLRAGTSRIGRFKKSSNRLYSTGVQVFDRRIKRIQRSRAVKRDVEESRNVDYLRDEVANRLLERLTFITRKFPNVLDLGSGAGSIERALYGDDNKSELSSSDLELVRSRLGNITMVEASNEMLLRDELPSNIKRLCMDEEEYIAKCKENTFDAILSNLSLHWINDLPSTFSNISNALKPDGMFMGSMIGGDSLFELRTSLQIGEIERYSRLTPRCSPLVDIKDMGQLLQKGGGNFNLTTIDVDDIVILYPNIFNLLNDIQFMGESNSIFAKSINSIPRDLLLSASQIYKSLHGEPDGSIPATFRVIYMIGWKPSPNQPQPLERGSGQINLQDAFNQKA